MKLAEALMERSDLKTRIEQLAARLNENAKVQEGDEPAENPAELLDENQNAISGSNASDYLVYTNSRIYKNIIPRT